MLYDAYLVTDWHVLPDVFRWLCAMRLAVFTPLRLLLIHGLRFARRHRDIDLMVVTASAMAALLPSIVTIFSSSPFFIIYQFGDVLTIVYLSLV